MPEKRIDPPTLEPREFRTPAEIDLAIQKLQRRIDELEHLDVRAAVSNHTGAVDVARSNIQEAIREVFGENSPEFREHGRIDIWGGPLFMGMSREDVIASTVRGKTHAIGILGGLIARLHEKRSDLIAGAAASPPTNLNHLNLHPRVRDVSLELFADGHPWEAVFAAAKALVNYVKERSGRHDLDGAPLVRAVFSRNDPILAVNALADQTDLDEQEGTMHLFEGAVLAVRNPGGHTFPAGSEQRAIEYISLLSLLAYKVQEANRKKNP